MAGNTSRARNRRLSALLGRRTLKWLLLSVGSGAAAVVVAWLLWPHPAPAPLARQYRDVSACLLTDPGGVAPGSAAAPAWSAMERASLVTHVMVSYFPVTKAADAAVMLDTLAQRQCGVIITAGTAPAQVVESARSSPRQRFILVTTAAGAVAGAPANLVVVATGDAPARIDQVIRALAATA
jgi:hypothetical protein